MDGRPARRAAARAAGGCDSRCQGEGAEEIDAAGVPAIFTENVSNPALIESIANEAGVAVGPPLYTDALGEAGTDGDTYIRMMTYNATSIVTALAA